MAKYDFGGALTIKATVVSYEDNSPIIGASIFLCDPHGSSGSKELVYVPVDQIVTYQPMTLEQRLAGLSVEQIIDALSRKDTALADALEAAGAKIAKARREAGEMRRTVKTKEKAPSEVTETHLANAPQDGLEVSTYMLAEMSARQGRKALDKFIEHIGVESREEINEFMPELLGVADAVDDDMATQKEHKIDIPF